MVSTMSGVAFGPAIRRAGSPGATLVMTKVSVATPSNVATRVSSFLPMNQNMPHTSGIEIQLVQIDFARQAHGAKVKTLEVIAHRPDAVSEHTEDFGLIRHNLRLDFGVQRGTLVPIHLGARRFDHGGHFLVVIVVHGVILPPAIGVVLVGHRVRVGADRRGVDRSHVRRGFGTCTVGHHGGPRLGGQFHLDVQVAQIVEQHQPDAARFFKTVDVHVIEREATFGVGRLRQVFLGTGKIAAWHISDVDVAAHRVREGTGL